jgi:hypothetical protein
MLTGGYSQIALLVKALGRGSPDLLKKGRLKILSYSRQQLIHEVGIEEAQVGRPGTAAESVR